MTGRHRWGRPRRYAYALRALTMTEWVCWSLAGAGLLFDRPMLFAVALGVVLAGLTLGFVLAPRP